MSVNKAILVGNLGKDPELRYTPSGTAVCTFSIATSEKFKDKQGEQQERTEWHNIVVWAGLAENCGKYLTKGKQIYLEGRISNRSYDGRDGNKRYITEIVANEVKFLGGGGQQNNSQGGQGNNQGSQQQRPAQNNQQNNNGQQNYAQGGGGYNEPPFNPDDDIPFALPMIYFTAGKDLF